MMLQAAFMSLFSCVRAPRLPPSAALKHGRIKTRRASIRAIASAAATRARARESFLCLLLLA